MRRVGALLCAVVLAVGAGGCATLGDAQNKIIYHVNLGDEQASDGLRNIRNHLSADPRAKIVVVTHSRGIDFLLKDAKDKTGNRYADQVERLQLQGVKFDVCANTMRGMKLGLDDILPGFSIVEEGGVVRLADLQAQGYAYLKP